MKLIFIIYISNNTSVLKLFLSIKKTKSHQDWTVYYFCIIKKLQNNTFFSSTYLSPNYT